MKVTWELDKADWTWLNLEIQDIKYNKNACEIIHQLFLKQKINFYICKSRQTLKEQTRVN